MTNLVFLIFMAIFSSPAIAGWISGGGELIEDSENPWFVQNTRVVKYCTIYDHNSYAQTPEITEDAIQKAIEFWISEFKYGQNLFEPRIEVATQDFIKISCPNGNRDADIVFQFGFLSDEQRTFIKNPTRYAGLAIRTEYDTVNLRGKGFVYIAADSGPFKFSGADTIESPWTVNEGGLLYWTLVHELGHIFGLSHTQQRGVGPGWTDVNVMAHDFIESITSRDRFSRFTKDQLVNPVFSIRFRRADRPRWLCGKNRSILRNFFGIDSSWQCLGIKMMAEDIAIFASNSPSDPSGDKLIGRASLERQNRKDAFVLLNPAVRFWLPPEQRMFPPRTNVYTPAYFVEDGVATYRNLDGTIERQMSYSLDPRKSSPLGDDLKIGGFLNGRLYVNLFEGI